MSSQLHNLSAATKYRKNSIDKITPPDLEEDFGVNTFSIDEMRKRLPKVVLQGMINCITKSAPIDTQHAEIVALTMKEWALERGATHFVHWFQPLTGGTAGKHDSFINPTDVGKAITTLRGSDLIQGEPDASSFPNGGLRATHEARGYTVWDPSSPAFLVENENGSFLAIPTCFVSWTGEALDHKTPLLRSIDALDRQARRVLRMLGENVDRVQTTVGAEQEYFLIDEEYYYRRPDLFNTGRTLVGDAPPKGQQLDDHYFGEIPSRQLACMLDAEKELYRLGIPVKTRHNEVAPSQYELAPVFETSGIASDHQQLIMITLKRIARKHGFVALLHEKPFADLNGSGKHINWSISTDSGTNLLDPGTTPHTNLTFLIFCTSVLRAVYKHQDLLRISVSSAGNDHRLGANEAPPAILSVFLGSQLSGVYQKLINGDELSSDKDADLFLGVSMLPLIPKHAGDRNRTSPFAFTGNKFEFRAAGSNQSLAFPNVVLNASVAESLRDFANSLRDALNGKDKTDPQVFKTTVLEILRENAKEFETILFEGDNYSDDWHEEAEKRGLLNLRTTPDALSHFDSEKNSTLFSSFGILTVAELKARQEIALEQYEMAIDIEGQTLKNLTQTQIIPACFEYLNELTQTASQARLVGMNVTPKSPAIRTATNVSKHLEALIDAVEELTKELDTHVEDLQENVQHKKDGVIPAMLKVRSIADELEGIIPQTKWPLPSYSEILFIH
ncbi:MAG: glutamine synthetase III [Bacteroidetes bacterium]|nr:glutamine synthetase III [Bacteroidota bacterium]MCY4234410.1 glutamine synthetase III [Bacteroidota bacterium]